jgi:NDP-sugar pyrophosphorylase family protein
MILAAGLGTRLRPLTDDRPKALVEVAAGKTMLELTLDRLRAFGIRDVIVNTHHFADKILAFLEAHDNFGMCLEVSREDELLDTGGGLKKAGWFFLDSAEPFLLHNVDVISAIDFERMLRFHLEQNALATLAVQHRQTSRYLLFDENGRLCGRRSARSTPQPSMLEDRDPELVRPVEDFCALAFSGIHIISPRIFTKIREEGAFSIISTYLRLAAEGERIVAFEADEFYWRDLGRSENVEQAARDIADGTYALA